MGSMTRRLGITLALLAGCAQPVATPPAAQHPSLPSLVGHEVTLQGAYTGPGKFGYFLKVGAEEVYLVDPVNAPWPRPDNEVTLVAKGKLQRSPEGCPSSSEAEACAPAYYFIEGAELKPSSAN